MSCLSNLSERGQGGDGPTRATERRAHGASSTRTRRATCATSKGKSASRSPPQQQTRGAAASAGGARAGSRRRLPPIATARWDAFCPPSPLEPLSPAPARLEPLSPASRARATARPSPTANACGGAGVSGGGARGEAAERDGGGGGEGRAEPRADEVWRVWVGGSTGSVAAPRPAPTPPRPSRLNSVRCSSSPRASACGHVQLVRGRDETCPISTGEGRDVSS